MEVRLFLKKISMEDSDSRKNSVKDHDPRQFDVLSSQTKFGSDSPSLDRLTPSLGCQCKVIGRKVYYGLGIPRPA